MCESKFLLWMFIFIAIRLINFTSNAVVCYKCNSITLEACAMALDGTEIPYVDCKSSLQCVMSIVDSITYRGCGPETPTIGATYKKSCSENLCNKGVYPPGRLKCHHCHGQECNEKPAGKPHPCLYHHEIDECYTEVNGPEEIYRGCKSDTNHTTIADNSIYCDINSCNDQPAVSILKCAQCDSKNGRGCKMDLIESNNNNNCNITLYDVCEVHSLLTRPESCFVYHNLDHVMRGCSKDLPESIVSDKIHITECNNGDFCNIKCLNQQQCLVCDSNSNISCRSNANEIRKNYCASAEASSCYACEYDNWQVKRGCGSPPETTEPLVNRCYECGPEEGCNSMTFRRCFKCTTANRNPSCATWERPEPGIIDIEECVHPDADCIMTTLSDGLTTMRGCESEYLQCNETMISCAICTGNFCNKGPYPPNRLQCYQCEGEENCVDVLSQDPLPCALSAFEPINERVACLQYMDQERGIIYGCSSNSTLYYRCMLYATDGCILCRENGCNGNLNAFQ